MKERNILDQFQEEKLVAVLRTETKNEFIEIAQTLLENNFKIIEVTLTTPQAMEIIKELSSNKSGIIGAGTVMDELQAEEAIKSGASFIVSPYFNKDIAECTKEYNIPYIPGCMTVKEMVEAKKFEVELIKLFPASQFSPKIIKDIKGPIPDIKIMPTGGVSSANIEDWLEAGSFAVGIGSEITKVFEENGKQSLIKYIHNLFGSVKS